MASLDPFARSLPIWPGVVASPRAVGPIRLRQLPRWWGDVTPAITGHPSQSLSPPAGSDRMFFCLDRDEGLHCARSGRSPLLLDRGLVIWRSVMRSLDRGLFVHLDSL